MLFVTGVYALLRGKAHVEWKVTRSGERRTVKEDQYLVDQSATVWGKGQAIFTRMELLLMTKGHVTHIIGSETLVNT